MVELLCTINTEVYFPGWGPLPHLNIKCFFWCLIDNHEDKVNVPAVEPEEQLYTQLGVGDESLTVKLALPG